MDVLVGVFADIRLGNIVANESEDRLKEVPEFPLGGFAALDFLRQGEGDAQDQARDQKHEQGVLREELEIAYLAQWHAEVPNLMGEMPDVIVEHMIESRSFGENHPFPQRLLEIV